MRWFNNLSTANKISLVGVLTALLSLLLSFLSSGKNDNTPDKINSNYQETHGANSPVINSGKDVNVNY